MSIIVFILLGLAACGFTRGLFNSTVGGVMVDLFLGVIGAVIAGSVFNHIATADDAPGLVIASGLAAIAGAAVLLAAYHAVFPGRLVP